MGEFVRFRLGVLLFLSGQTCGRRLFAYRDQTKSDSARWLWTNGETTLQVAKWVVLSLEGRGPCANSCGAGATRRATQCGLSRTSQSSVVQSKDWQDWMWRPPACHRRYGRAPLCQPHRRGRVSVRGCCSPICRTRQGGAVLNWQLWNAGHSRSS